MNHAIRTPSDLNSGWCGVESTARSCQKHLPAGAVLDTGDLLAEPTFESRGIIQTMEHPNGTMRRPTFPVRFDGAPPKLGRSPLLGEHNSDVFGEWLGMSAGDIAGMKSDGII